jgi:hypothetical protein
VCVAPTAHFDRVGFLIQRHNGPRSNRRAALARLRIAPGDWSGREKDRCRGTGFHERYRNTDRPLQFFRMTISSLRVRVRFSLVFKVEAKERTASSRATGTKAKPQSRLAQAEGDVR